MGPEFKSITSYLSVLVVNCPREKTYDVFLTKHEGGAPKLKEKGVNVIIVKESNEARFPGALIVLTKDSKNGNEVYRATRYWSEVDTQTGQKRIQTEHVIDQMEGPFEDLFVFDGYAVMLKEGGKLI